MGAGAGRLRAGTGQGPVQGGQAPSGVPARMDVGAADAPGQRIGDQAQVHRALAGGQASEVTNPRA